MDIDLADLPDNVETLQRMVRTLAAERADLTEAQAEIERLRLIVQKLQRSQLPPSTSTVLIAKQSVLPLISRTFVACCKSTAMLASSG